MNFQGWMHTMLCTYPAQHLLTPPQLEPIFWTILLEFSTGRDLGALKWLTPDAESVVMI